MMTVPIDELARDRGGVQRPGAAVGDEREVGGVEAALGGHPAHHMRHLRRGDAQDAFGGFDRIEAERRRDLLGQRLFRRGEIELHLAAEEAVGAEAAEHQVGVGDGRLGAAEAVADRARRRAGRFRADAQRVADLDAGDAAAAGADLLDVDHRHLHRQAGGVAADQRRAGHQHVAFVDHAGLGRGAAHVEGYRIGNVDGIAQRLGADHAGGGARLQHADAGLPRVARRRTARRSIAR